MKKTVCYFGNFDPEFGRNRVMIAGLKKIGFSVIECIDNGGKVSKYIRLFIKHWKIRNDYDFIIVGYPSRLPVIFARLISSKPVVLDAICSLYEVVVISRKQFKEKSFKAFAYKAVDYIAMKFAHITLVETENQRKFFY